MNFKEGFKQGRLDEFIKEHERDSPGDMERVEHTIRQMAQSEKSKEARKTSDWGSSES